MQRDNHLRPGLLLHYPDHVAGDIGPRHAVYVAATLTGIEQQSER